MKLFVTVAAAMLPACGASASSGPSNDQACTEQAKARCGKTQECSTYWWNVRYGGDDAACERIEKQYCMNAFAAPSSAKTAQKTADCTAAVATWSCGDWLANNVPPACVAAAGALGNAAPCAFASQCASGFCAVPQNFGCGKCAPATKVGDSCASTQVCAAEATGQYCSQTTLVCTSPVGQGGTCDNVNLLCTGGLSCAGLTMTANGTCQPAVTTQGADCMPTGQGGAGCDRHHGLVCDGASKKCVAMTFAAAGQPCGVVNNLNVPCADEGLCLIANGQKAGACVGIAADGAPCDTDVGPSCAFRSSCVITSGSKGTCQPTSFANCH